MNRRKANVAQKTKRPKVQPHDHIDPPAWLVEQEGHHTRCVNVNCGGKWPGPTGECGYCVGKRKLLLQRVYGTTQPAASAEPPADDQGG